MSWKRAIVASLTVIVAPPADAYIGPGAGLGAIGAAIALGIAILLLLVGFVWYPLKRLLKGRKSAIENETKES